MTNDTPPALFPVGKLPADRLRAMLAALGAPDPRLIVGPRVGEDAAVLDMGDRCLVVSTDPVTLATEHIGWYAVHVNANDVAVMGARPRWFLPVVLLPDGATTDAMVGQIMSEIVAACETLGVTVCGGHTEVTAGLDRPVVVGQMMGEVDRGTLVQKTQLRPGDRLLLTRGVAIEGTAILAREWAATLAGQVSDDVLDRARALLRDPGISVVGAAMAAVEVGGVRAMHDPTEGGVLTAIAELAAASGQGLRVSIDRIPVYPETEAICRALGLDPFGLIASGALLVGAAPDVCPSIVAALARQGIATADIGEVVPADEGVTTDAGGIRRPLVAPDRDELARLSEP